MISISRRLDFSKPVDTIVRARELRHMGFGQFIFFGRGTADDFCAYTAIQKPGGQLMASFPSDAYYYEIAEQLGVQYGIDVVYDDIRHLYEHAGKDIDQRLIDEIYAMAMAYGGDFQYALNMFMHMYYGMVAEENKDGTQLGKSLKMFGVHSLLRERVPVDDAANCCRGVSADAIREKCAVRHIYRMV